MKVVTCTHCGKKYRLEDYEDIDEYECSVCTGTLALSEEYETEDSKKTNIFNPYVDNPNVNIVECTNCGLRYQLKKKQNIFDYVCTSCESPLKYLDEDLNNEMNQIVEENIKYTSTSSNHKEHSLTDNSESYVNPEEGIYVDHSDDGIYTGHNDDGIYVDHSNINYKETNTDNSTSSEEDIIIPEHNIKESPQSEKPSLYPKTETTPEEDLKTTPEEELKTISKEDLKTKEKEDLKTTPEEELKTKQEEDSALRDAKIREAIKEHNKPFNETLKENTASMLSSISNALSFHSKPKIPKNPDYNALHKYIKAQFLENMNIEYDVYEELHNGEKKTSNY